MPEWLKPVTTRMEQLARGGGLWWGLALSVGLAVVSLAVATTVVVSWPPGRFMLVGDGARSLPTGSLALRALASVGKNVAGVVLVVLGAIMALPGVPGQGFLTMLIGLTLIDFPGKVDLERRLVRRPFVLRQLNALRARFKRAPLVLD